MVDNKKNDNLNAIRMLGLDAVNEANSGHPGIVLDAAPIVYALFTQAMKIDPKNPDWFNRDRFILSAGHGSSLLYAINHLVGYNVSLEDLKAFRKWGSNTPGHPEKGIAPGVEVTTGPLGQGVGMGVGMALAEQSLAARFNKEGLNLVDHYTFVLCGDGDLQEGVANEAISFAGKNQLKKLVLIHDSNDVQLDDYVKAAQIENFAQRFQAANWNTIKVDDGEDLDAILKALETAKDSDKPTYIEVKTIIGLGATKQGTPAVHGAPLGDDMNHVRDYFGWKHEPFTVPSEVYKHYQDTTQKQGALAHQQWEATAKAYKEKFPNEYKVFEDSLAKRWVYDMRPLLDKIPPKPQATRVSSGMVLDYLAQQIPTMVGGSADLASSTRIAGPDGQFSPQNYKGRNIMYGVREFAMTTINNGMSAHGGILPFGSGFFVFADYMKAGMRLASLMQLQQLFIFTHDSVAVGEDGPTHEPVEQLAMLRSIPGMVVFRPADFEETVGAYDWALTHPDTPTTIVASRQNLPELLHDDPIKEVGLGAYIIDDADQPKVTLIATGSEVSLAIEAKIELEAKGYPTRVVSMPSWEVFAQQDEEYKKKVIDKNTTRVSLEMATTFGWERHTGDEGLNIGIDRFGESAPGPVVMEKLGFTAKQVSEKILSFLQK